MHAYQWRKGLIMDQGYEKIQTNYKATLTLNLIASKVFNSLSSEDEMSFKLGSCQIKVRVVVVSMLE